MHTHPYTYTYVLEVASVEYHANQTNKYSGGKMMFDCQVSAASIYKIVA